MRTKNKKYPHGKYVSEKTLEKREQERQKEMKDHQERNKVEAPEEDEADRLSLIHEMNIEDINQKYAANLIVMTLVGLYNISRGDYITENMQSIIFALTVQTINFGCTVYRAHLTETRQIHRCKYLPTIFRVVKAASYWLMLNLIIDYMDNHMAVTNWTTLLRWSLIITNKGFIAYLAYAIFLSGNLSGNPHLAYWYSLADDEDDEEDTRINPTGSDTGINLTDSNDEDDDEVKDCENGNKWDDGETTGLSGSSDDEEDETNGESSDEEETSYKKNN